MDDAALPAGSGGPDTNRGPVLIAATSIVTLFALFSVLARSWVRAVMIKSFGWDDTFMVAAMTLSMVAMLLVIPDVYYGAGRHAAFLTDPDKKSYGLYINFISQPFFLVGVIFVKVSIGLFLLRLTPSISYHRFIWAMQIFMAVYTTIALCTIVTQCRPISVLWDSKVTNAICFSPLALRACAYFNAACGIFADLVFALLPIPMLWKVKINSRVKLALVGILSLGLFATAACIVKVYYLSFYGKYNDFLWDSVNITIWTACELNIGIFAASIATLKPLFRATFRGTGSGTDEYSKKATKSMDKSGFVKHISNSGGTRRAGGMRDDKDDIEMYGSVVLVDGRKASIIRDSASEEELIGPRKENGIMKTTQIHVERERGRS